MCIRDRAGFDKARLFYTQGDYGLWKCSRPCHKRTYDNETAVRQMLEAQGFSVRGNDGLTLPLGTVPKMTVPPELVPRCPKCGAPMSMNLRCDAAFVEGAGWHAAAARYQDFVEKPVSYTHLDVYKRQVVNYGKDYWH